MQKTKEILQQTKDLQPDLILNHQNKDNIKFSILAFLVASSTLIAAFFRNKEHRKFYALEECPSKKMEMDGKKKNKCLINSELISDQIQQISFNNTKDEFLEGYLIKANSKLRKATNLIVFYHSHKTTIINNLQFAKNFVENTVVDLLIVQYRYKGESRNQITLKNDAQAIFKKAIQLAQKKDQSLVILGQGLGAMLGIYICSLPQYRFMYRLKGLIIENCFLSLADLKANNQKNGFFKNFLHLLYKIILKDTWQSVSLIKKLRVPTMLIMSSGKEKDQSYQLYQHYKGAPTIFEDKINPEEESKSSRNFTEYFMEINVFLNSLP